MSRQAALKTCLLLDITPTAHATFLMMPSALSPALWRAIAGEHPFEPRDPRVACLTWSFYLCFHAGAYAREIKRPQERIVWFDALVLGRKVQVKAAAHPGDADETVMTFSLPQEQLCFPLSTTARSASSDARAGVAAASGTTLSGLDLGPAARPLTFDLSPIAKMAFIETPLALSTRLWRAIADEQVFCLNDPRLLELCWAVLHTVVTHTQRREELLPYRHTIWARAVIGGREIPYKLITHPDPANHRRPVMSLLAEDEELDPTN